jgi:hypothetical protein
VFKMSSIFIERLFEEWKQHGNIIIGVDFDDTVSPWKFSQSMLDSFNIIQLLKECQQVGAYIICFTACDSNRYIDIKNKFEELGLDLSAINANAIDLPYGNNNKPYANIYLDDRAGLESALDILNKALWKYKGYKAGIASIEQGLP